MTRCSNFSAMPGLRYRVVGAVLLWWCGGLACGEPLGADGAPFSVGEDRPALASSVMAPELPAYPRWMQVLVPVLDPPSLTLPEQEEWLLIQQVLALQWEGSAMQAAQRVAQEEVEKTAEGDAWEGESVQGVSTTTVR